MAAAAVAVPLSQPRNPVGVRGVRARYWRVRPSEPAGSTFGQGTRIRDLRPHDLRHTTGTFAAQLARMPCLAAICSGARRSR
jgi:hypothetical protein